MSVCAQPVEIKEFECLLHWHYCAVLREVQEQ